MSDFTFLDREHLNNDLEVFNKFGRNAQITDFAIVLGGRVSEFEDFKTPYYFNTTTGLYWTKVDDCDGDVFVIDGDGKTSHDWVERRNIGARPILPFSLYAMIPTNGNPSKKLDKGIFEEEYGYYPQTAAPVQLQSDLEALYKANCKDW